MATGLPTFDAFSWASLLKGRRILVVDRDGRRGRATVEALEEAGAEVSFAPNQAFAGDRLREGAFRHLLLALGDGEAVAPRIGGDVAAAGRSAILLAAPVRHGELRAAFPAARIGDHSMDARSVVMFVTETADE